MNLSILPTVNAMFNAISALFLISGFLFIKRRRISAHQTCMLGAVSTSVLFLISYLFYHYHHGATRFTGVGWTRPFYFTVLISQTILAAAIVSLVIITLKRALGRRFDRHKRIARWALPMWLYVSVTGVIVYLMLYHFFPSR